ncbi:HAD family hydrolase [Ensifer sp.]|uniref:HAD family hydrolase n=1 Tax=Ensifer sp. TaxID=1872086 RepID=UPI00289A624C|nr:HAD family hydrolase [Ensifer sp.]
MDAFARGLIFDLDDTLYLERDFVFSGFAAVGAWWQRRTGRGDFAARCTQLYQAGARGNIFNHALAEVDGDVDPALVEQLVSVYRDHQPSISLAPDVARFLRGRRSDDFLGIITDGPAPTQRAKISALGLEQKVDLVLCTDAWGIGYRKPHPRAFETTETTSRLMASQLIYVADNAIKDFVTPRARGWKTVQILRPERVHACDPPTPMHQAQSQIFTFDDLEQAIRDIS